MPLFLVKKDSLCDDYKWKDWIIPAAEKVPWLGRIPHISCCCFPHHHQGYLTRQGGQSRGDSAAAASSRARLKLEGEEEVSTNTSECSKRQTLVVMELSQLGSLLVAISCRHTGTVGKIDLYVFQLKPLLWSLWLSRWKSKPQSISIRIQECIFLLIAQALQSCNYSWKCVFSWSHLRIQQHSQHVEHLTMFCGITAQW